jgi:hypothetical protein
MPVADDNRSVVMKVDIRWGVCNNSPVEATSSKNEWRQSFRAQPMESILRSRSSAKPTVSYIQPFNRDVEEYKGTFAVISGETKTLLRTLIVYCWPTRLMARAWKRCCLVELIWIAVAAIQSGCVYFYMP